MHPIIFIDDQKQHLQKLVTAD